MVKAMKRNTLVCLWALLFNFSYIALAFEYPAGAPCQLRQRAFAERMPRQTLMTQRALLEYLSGGGSPRLRPGRTAAQSYRPAINQEALMTYLAELLQAASDPSESPAAREEAERTYHRTLKLIAASMRNDPGILMRYGPLPESDMEQTIRNIGQFSAEGFDENNLRQIVMAAGRERSYYVIIKKLGEAIIPNVIDVVPVESVTTAFAKPHQLSITRQALDKYLEELQRQETDPESDPDGRGDALTMLHRTLKLILAATGEPEILKVPGALSSKDKARALQKSEEFCAQGFDDARLMRLAADAGKRDRYREVIGALRSLAVADETPPQYPPRRSEAPLAALLSAI